MIRNTVDLNQSFHKFCQILKNNANKHAPLRDLSRTERKRIERPWFTLGIEKSIETRQKYYIESLYNAELRERYTKYRNMLKRMITKSKRNVNKKKILLSNNKSKAMWEVINTSLHKKPKSCRKKDSKNKKMTKIS